MVRIVKGSVRMPVSIVEPDGRMAVTASYHPDFLAKSGWLAEHGMAIGARGCFDAGDPDRVASLCGEIYGADGVNQSSA